MFAVIVQNTLETYGDSFAEATASVSKTTQLLVIAVGLNCLVRILLHATCMWRYLLEVLSRWVHILYINTYNFMRVLA